jgi:hypothetical protein
MLTELSEEMKSAVLSQRISHRMRYFHNRTSKDPATVAEEAIVHLDGEWKILPSRLMVIPGKQLLSDLNGKLQKTYGISITASQIVRNLTPENVSSDLKEILQSLNDFAMGQRSSTLGRSAA